MQLAITPIYAALLAIMMIGLSMYVSALRSDQSVSIGPGEGQALLERIRRHGNFVENVPMALLLIAMAEITGLPGFWVHMACVVLLVSRIIQPLGLRHDAPFTALRLAGNLGTFISILGASGFILFQNFV